jgi:hypothetical protein
LSTVQNMHLVLFLNMIVSRIQHNLNTIAFHIIVNPCICLSIFPDRSWITNKWGPDTRWFSRDQEFSEVIVSGSVSYILLYFIDIQLKVYYYLVFSDSRCGCRC